MKQHAWKFRRLILRRGDDNRVYLNRWGFRTPWFGVYLHKMEAPDPGADLHDHPWPFVSLILKGQYTEQIANIRDLLGPQITGYQRRQVWERTWKRGSIHVVRMDEAHTISKLIIPTWTLVLTGKVHRKWGFYEVDDMFGHFVDNTDYASERRNISVETLGGSNEKSADEKPRRYRGFLR